MEPLNKKLEHAIIQCKYQQWHDNWSQQQNCVQTDQKKFSYGWKWQRLNDNLFNLSCKILKIYLAFTKCA